MVDETQLALVSELRASVYSTGSVRGPQILSCAGPNVKLWNNRYVHVGIDIVDVIESPIQRVDPDNHDPYVAGNGPAILPSATSGLKFGLLSNTARNILLV